MRRARMALPGSLVVTLLGAAGTAQAQSNCNQPARDSIVHIPMPANPFEPVVTADGCWIFVTLVQQDSPQASLAVLRRAAGTVTLVRRVIMKGTPAGAVLTHDGRLLIVAAGGWLGFLDVGRLQSGQGDPVLGYMGDDQPTGMVYVNVTPDDKTVFVAAERAASVLAIDLVKARARGYSDAATIGSIATGNAPIAVTLSPDARYLYVTSQSAPPAWNWPNECRPEGSAAGTPDNHSRGAVLVIDVARARTDPANAVLSRVPAGCNPVRLVLSPAGDVAYVTARGDNALLAFDTQKLRTDTAHARIGRGRVGTAPVGVAVIDAGRSVVVTSSNRFAANVADSQPLYVLDAARLRAGSATPSDSIPAGGFARELRVTADGRTLVVTNYVSRTLQLVDLARLQLRH